MLKEKKSGLWGTGKHGTGCYTLRPCMHSMRLKRVICSLRKLRQPRERRMRGWRRQQHAWVPCEAISLIKAKAKEKERLCEAF